MYAFAPLPAGPFLPNPLMGPGYIQFEDSFLVIGGYDTDAARYKVFAL